MFHSESDWLEDLHFVGLIADFLKLAHQERADWLQNASQLAKMRQESIPCILRRIL